MEGLKRSSHLRHKLKILVLHLWCSGINSYLLHSNRFYSPGGDSGAKLTGMTIKRGKIKTHKSPNETQKSPWTKIKPERVTCLKTELFFFQKRNWMNTDLRCPMSIGSDIRHQTADFGDWTSDIGHRTDVRCPMSDVRCLMSDVQCPISDVWFPMFDIRCVISDAWCLISNVRCPISDVWCPLSVVRCPASDVWYWNSLPGSCRRTTSRKEFRRFHFFP